jgi:hypothetical protein
VKSDQLILKALATTPITIPKECIVYFVSVSSSSPYIALRLAITLSCFRSRAAFLFARLASISSFMILSRAFSALALWICRPVSICSPSRSLVIAYVLNQCSLVLECVTLAEMVQLVVEMLVNLAAGTVLDEKTAENSESSHPHNLTIQSFISTCIPFTSSSIPLRACICSKNKVLHTLASEHQQYPSSYRNLDVYRFVERLGDHGPEIESAL